MWITQNNIGWVIWLHHLGKWKDSILEPKLLLKGVFVKNERGYRFKCDKKRLWSLLILLLSVASIRSKLLKTTNTEDPIFNLNHKQINWIPNKSFRYYSHRLFFDAFVNSWYFIIFCIFHDLRVTLFPVSRIFDNEDDIFIFSRNVRKSSASEN